MLGNGKHMISPEGFAIKDLGEAPACKYIMRITESCLAVNEGQVSATRLRLFLFGIQEHLHIKLVLACFF